MSNGLSLITGSAGQPPPQLVWGQVSTAKAAPTSFTEPLYVVQPQWQPHYYWTVTTWPALYGATLPAQGADVMLALDSARNYRVIWWSGVHT